MSSPTREELLHLLADIAFRRVEDDSEHAMDALVDAGWVEGEVV